MVKPINRQTINPTITAAACDRYRPETGQAKLWDMAAPNHADDKPRHPVSSPLRKSCRRASPPGQQVRPASCRQFKRGDCEQWADSGNPGGIARGKIRKAKPEARQNRGTGAERIRSRIAPIVQKLCWARIPITSPAARRSAVQTWPPFEAIERIPLFGSPGMCGFRKMKARKPSMMIGIIRPTEG